MRILVKTFFCLTLLLHPAWAQNTAVQGETGTVNIGNDGSIQVTGSQGSQFSRGADGQMTIKGATQRRNRDLVVTRGERGELYIVDRNSNESVSIDNRPGGVTVLQSQKGNLTAPTDLVRALLRSDNDADVHLLLDALGL